MYYFGFSRRLRVKGHFTATLSPFIVTFAHIPHRSDVFVHLLFTCCSFALSLSLTDDITRVCQPPRNLSHFSLRNNCPLPPCIIPDPCHPLSRRTNAARTETRCTRRSRAASPAAAVARRLPRAAAALQFPAAATRRRRNAWRMQQMTGTTWPKVRLAFFLVRTYTAQ